MMEKTQITSNEVIKKIKSAKNVALFAHKNPDPDAYGSMFAMREICKNFGVNADVFAIKTDNDNLKKIFPLNEVKSVFKTKEYDLVIMLDIFSLKRINYEFVEEIKMSSNIMIIDHHHIGNEELASQNHYIIPDKSATCEILTDLCIENKIEITPKIATYLWAGLIGDTSRFLHNNLSNNVLRDAQILFEKGANVQFVYDALYRSVSMKHLNLVKTFINKLKFLENGKVGYVIFTEKDLKKLGLSRDILYILYGDIITIDGVEASFFISEISKDNYKVSVRTKGLDSLKISQKMDGGGHTCASAFVYKFSLAKLKKELPVWAKEILDV